jgi:hypothetical protein
MEEIITAIIEALSNWMDENGEGIRWGLSIGSFIRNMKDRSKNKKEAAKKKTASKNKKTKKKSKSKKRNQK